MADRKETGDSSGEVTTSAGRKMISPLDVMADTFAQFLKDMDDVPEN
jgi:hypothetical protein